MKQIAVNYSVTFKQYKDFIKCIIKNIHQTVTIKTNDCKFNHTFKLSEKSYYGSIYYTTNTSSTSTSSHTVLFISNCVFSDSEVNETGGLIYIIFENKASPKQVEISV